MLFTLHNDLERSWNVYLRTQWCKTYASRGFMVESAAAELFLVRGVPLWEQPTAHVSCTHHSYKPFAFTNRTVLSGKVMGRWS